MKKLYYTIGEVAQLLGENVSLVRFWSDTFGDMIHPARNAKGNRLFTPEDVETFRQIHFLVKKRGYTLDGAVKELAENRLAVESRVRAIEMLKSIRTQLSEVRQMMNK